MMPPTPSQDGASQTMETVMQGLVKSSLTQFGVIPQESPDQSQAQSDTREPEPPQTGDISSEGDIPDSDQKDRSGTPILEELLMGREELEDYDSLSLPVINETPLWKFTQQPPSGCQAQTNTATTQAQPATSTPAKPAVPQSKALASGSSSSSNTASGSSSAG